MRPASKTAPCFIPSLNENESVLLTIIWFTLIEQRRIQDFFKEGVVMRVQGKCPRAKGMGEGEGGSNV